MSIFETDKEWWGFLARAMIEGESEAADNVSAED